MTFILDGHYRLASPAAPAGSSLVDLDRENGVTNVKEGGKKKNGRVVTTVSLAVIEPAGGH